MNSPNDRIYAPFAKLLVQESSMMITSMAIWTIMVTATIQHSPAELAFVHDMPFQQMLLAAWKQPCKMLGNKVNETMEQAMDYAPICSWRLGIDPDASIQVMHTIQDLLPNRSTISNHKGSSGIAASA